jgi:hypothetical protein
MAASAVARAFFAVLHHTLDMQVFETHYSTCSGHIAAELVLGIRSNVGNLGMDARHFDALFVVVLAEDPMARLGVFGALAATELALRLAQLV